MSRLGDLWLAELDTSKSANKAFKQALSEIGTVVISAVMGENEKVEIHTVEFDPEILSKISLSILW